MSRHTPISTTDVLFLLWEHEGWLLRSVVNVPKALYRPRLNKPQLAQSTWGRHQRELASLPGTERSVPADVVLSPVVIRCTKPEQVFVIWPEAEPDSVLSAPLAEFSFEVDGPQQSLWIKHRRGTTETRVFQLVRKDGCQHLKETVAELQQQRQDLARAQRQDTKRKRIEELAARDADALKFLQGLLDAEELTLVGNFELIHDTEDTYTRRIIGVRVCLAKGRHIEFSLDRKQRWTIHVNGLDLNTFPTRRSRARAT